jgi:hypothetical protein
VETLLLWQRRIAQTTGALGERVRILEDKLSAAREKEQEQKKDAEAGVR